MTDTAIAELAPQVGVRAACEVLGVAQTGYYRRHRQTRHRSARIRPRSGIATSLGR